jgi:outer membrane beta-barrel protein
MTKKILNCNFFALFAVIVAFASSSAFAEDKGDKKQPDPNQVGNYRVEGIDVVQQRVFTKSGRHELSADVGLITNHAFIKYETLNARYSYHFREGLAFEGAYTHAFHQEKGILQDLANIPCPTGSDAFFDSNGDLITDCGVHLQGQLDPMENAYFGNVVWSPIYGKFSIFSKKIFHFDIFITAGAGLIQNKITNKFAFNVGGGGKIYINDWFAVRLDFRNYTVQEDKPFNNIINNRMVSLGASFFLPPHPVKD